MILSTTVVIVDNEIDSVLLTQLTHVELSVKHGTTIVLVIPLTIMVTVEKDSVWEATVSCELVVVLDEVIFSVGYVLRVSKVVVPELEEEVAMFEDIEDPLPLEVLSAEVPVPEVVSPEMVLCEDDSLKEAISEEENKEVAPVVVISVDCISEVEITEEEIIVGEIVEELSLDEVSKVDGFVPEAEVVVT